MRLAAHIGVKDEVELVAHALRHLRAIGIGDIVVSDMGSTDGTREVLEEFSAQGVCVLDRSDGPDALPYWADDTLAAARDLDADWVVFLDADEFLLPASGRLADCSALANSEVLLVERFNVPLSMHGPLMPADLAPASYGETWLLADHIPGFRQHLLRAPETPWIRGVPLPKVMARPQCIDRLAIGAHGAETSSGEALREAPPWDLLIAHVPFSTPSRFRTKVDNVRRAMDLNKDFFSGLAWHWRRWIEIADAEGSTDREFERQRMDPATVAQLQRDGVIRSVAEMFESRAPDGSMDGNGTGSRRLGR